MSFVWPKNSNHTTTFLSNGQLRSWEKDGYLVIPNIFRPNHLQDSANAIREFVGANEHDKESWYKNTLDIYTDKTPDGKRPHHGPCGVVQLVHHRALWELRQEPRLHAAFSDLYGTHRLFVTADRAHFKPPQSLNHPEWSNPGNVHVGLHWDVDTRRVAWPIPYVIQGVVYLEDTAADQGALRLVPGFHHRFSEWDSKQPENRSGERPEGEAAEALEREAIAIAGPAGSLIVWHSLLPHGPAKNLHTRPRVSAYVTMLPVNASKYLGPGRGENEPLGMSDAGTLQYWDGWAVSSKSMQEAPTSSSCVEDGANFSVQGVRRRQSRDRRVERWRLRLPLLDEDPGEEELAFRPLGEEAGMPASLTPLGRKLVGLDVWEDG